MRTHQRTWVDSGGLTDYRYMWLMSLLACFELFHDYQHAYLGDRYTHLTNETPPGWGHLGVCNQ